MSRSTLRPEHALALHNLREWARKQGRTPTGISLREGAAHQALAQAAASAPADDPKRMTAATPLDVPAPDKSSEGAD